MENDGNDKKKITSSNLHKFPGSLEEYNQLTKQEYEIMDTGMPDLFVKENDYSKIDELIERGCVGFIRYSLNPVYLESYGIPVKRKS